MFQVTEKTDSVVLANRFPSATTNSHPADLARHASPGALQAPRIRLAFGIETRYPATLVCTQWLTGLDLLLQDSQIRF